MGHLAHCIAEADRDLLPQLEHIRARPETDPVAWAGVRSASAHDAARNAAVNLFCTIHNACMKRGDTHALTPDVVRARAGSKKVREAVIRELGRGDLDHESTSAMLTSEAAKAMQLSEAAAHWPPGRPVIHLLGDCMCRIGEQTLRIDQMEETVLVGFVRRPAMTMADMKGVIGYNGRECVGIIRRLETKYDGALARHPPPRHPRGRRLSDQCLPGRRLTGLDAPATTPHYPPTI